MTAFDLEYNLASQMKAVHETMTHVNDKMLELTNDPKLHMATSYAYLKSVSASLELKRESLEQILLEHGVVIEDATQNMVTVEHNKDGGYVTSAKEIVDYYDRSINSRGNGE